MSSWWWIIQVFGNRDTSDYHSIINGRLLHRNYVFIHTSEARSVWPPQGTTSFQHPTRPFRAYPERLEWNVVAKVQYDHSIYSVAISTSMPLLCCSSFTFLLHFKVKSHCKAFKSILFVDNIEYIRCSDPFCISIDAPLASNCSSTHVSPSPSLRIFALMSPCHKLQTVKSRHTVQKKQELHDRL